MNTNIIVQLTNRTNKVIIYEDITVHICNKHIKIPKGFLTDLASVPRVLWPFFPPRGRYTLAAIVHDYLYYKKIYSRELSDRIFLAIMEKSNVSYFKRTLFYKTVRMFGQKRYDNANV